MQLQTHINIPEEKPKIDYSSKVLLLGSCFSENIGEKFAYYQFQQLQNPFGILFHPFAIESFIKKVVSQQKYTEQEIFEHQEIFSCFDAHSRLNALSKEELLSNLNSALVETFQFLKKATHITITLGTAWIYKHIEQNKYVANCHKIPQKNFQKELSSVEGIEKSLQNIIAYIQQINTNGKFIFTISPVRHAKDGLVENQQSKAHLIAALHQIRKKQENLYYFPSYEIMMDELRDYRFYAADLLHPNQIAVDYIWDKFVDTWFSSSTLAVMKEVKQIQQGLAHKPFNAHSDAHQKFQKKLQQKVEKLQQQFSFFKF